MPELWKDRNFFLLHNNARPHTATVVHKFLTKKRGNSVERYPYSPGLSLPNYFASPRLKLEVKRTHYPTFEHIQKSVMAKLKAFPVFEFKKATDKLQYPASECIRANGDYFE